LLKIILNANLIPGGKVKHICKRLRGLVSGEKLDVTIIEAMTMAEFRKFEHHISGCKDCQKTIKSIKERGSLAKLILKKNGL